MNKYQAAHFYGSRCTRRPTFSIAPGRITLLNADILNCYLTQSDCSDLVSKWMGHIITTTFLARSYCQPCAGCLMTSFRVSTGRRSGASSTRHRRFPWARDASSSKRLCPCTRGTFQTRIWHFLRQYVTTTNNSAKCPYFSYCVLITSDEGGGKCVCPRSFVCLSVHLSVSKITQKRVHGFGWNVACRQISGHGRTDYLLSPKPDPDYSPDAGTGLLSPISYALKRGILLRRENPTYRYWALVAAARREAWF